MLVLAAAASAHGTRESASRSGVMSATPLLSRLEGVRGRDGSWRARCPVHGSKSGTLSIRELPDGRVLMKCHAACATEDILAEIGFNWEDLFARRLVDDRLPRARKPWRTGDVIRAFKFELMVALVILADVASGKAVSETDRERAGTAWDRIVRFLKELDDAC
jgi:hypothetical protein